MKKLTLIILLFCSSAMGVAQTRHTIVKSSVTFEIKNMGFKCTGTFSGLEATLLFDKDHLSTSSIEASVETKTVNTDDEMRDKHLKKEDYFDVEHFPKIVIKSASFRQKSGSNYLGDFDLIIKGKTKRIEVPFTYVVNGSTAVFKGSFKINRLDFNVGDHSMILSNEATIFLNVETAL